MLKFSEMSTSQPITVSMRLSPEFLSVSGGPDSVPTYDNSSETVASAILIEMTTPTAALTSDIYLLVDRFLSYTWTSLVARALSTLIASETPRS